MAGVFCQDVVQLSASDKPPDAVASESKHSDAVLAVVTAGADVAFVTSPSGHNRAGSSSTRMLAVSRRFERVGWALVVCDSVVCAFPERDTGRGCVVAALYLSQMRQLSASGSQPHEKRLLSRVPSQRLLSALSNRVRRFSVA